MLDDGSLKGARASAVSVALTRRRFLDGDDAFGEIGGVAVETTNQSSERACAFAERGPFHFQAWIV
jgi:hypothetical protein